MKRSLSFFPPVVFFTCLILLFFLVFVAGRPAAGESRLSLLENDFLSGMARVNMFQVRLGVLASERRGVNNDVRDFGRRMVETHSKLQEDLKRIAVKYKIFLPDRMDPFYKEEIERMTLMPPGEFGRNYRDMMIRQHGRDIAVLKKISEGAKIPEIRQFAREVLPKTKEMLEKARAMEI
jgi:putative membrane protein